MNTTSIQCRSHGTEITVKYQIGENSPEKQIKTYGENFGIELPAMEYDPLNPGKLLLTDGLLGE